MVHFLGRNKIPNPWVVYFLGRNKIPTPRVLNFTNFPSFWRNRTVTLTNFFANFTNVLYFDELFRRFHEFFYILKIMWNSIALHIVVLLLKFIRIGLLTNRLGRNKIPYHLGNNSSPCGFAARGRIISLVVRNFIPTRAIGQESYIRCCWELVHSVSDIGKYWTYASKTFKEKYLGCHLRYAALSIEMVELCLI